MQEQLHEDGNRALARVAGHGRGARSRVAMLTPGTRSSANVRPRRRLMSMAGTVPAARAPDRSAGFAASWLITST